MNNLFDRKESWRQKIELLTDVQTCLNQLANGEGITHQEAKNMIMKRISNVRDKKNTAGSKILD